jgi:hypothetical protein
VVASTGAVGGVAFATARKAPLESRHRNVTGRGLFYLFHTHATLCPLPGSAYCEHNTGTPKVDHRMSSKLDAHPSSFKTTGSKYSYSLKRWNAFDAWQEHIRKSATSAGSAFAARPDRDLRRAVVAG